MTHHYCAALHHKHVSLTGSLSNSAGNMEEANCLSVVRRVSACVCLKHTHLDGTLKIRDTGLWMENAPFTLLEINRFSFFSVLLHLKIINLITFNKIILFAIFKCFSRLKFIYTFQSRGTLKNNLFSKIFVKKDHKSQLIG